MQPAAALGAPAAAGPPDATNTQNQTPGRSEDLRGQPAATFDFSVPPGSLPQVLDAVVAQAGAKYRVEGGAISGSVSPGVGGRMTLHAAVAQALVGSGWRVTSVTNGEIRLQPDAASGVTVDAIVVTARRQAFKENYSSAATLANTPLIDTPATVDVVTQDVLQSRNDYSLGEAIQNIPGAIFQQAGSPNQIVIGPESTDGASFTDGLRDGALADNEPTVLVDSIEVLKGPSSLLTGTAVGGGLLNYVPKRANGVNPAAISFGYGSGDEWTGSFDVGGALPDVSHAYFRVIGLAQHADDNPAGGNDPYQYVISPMLGYRSDNTTADVGFQYFDQRVPFARRDFMDAQGNIESYGSLYNPDTRITTDFKQVDYNLDQTLISTADWTMKLRFKGLFQDGDREIAAALPALQLTPTLFGVVSVSEYLPEQANSQHVDLYNKFDTGPLEHQVIVGADYNLSDLHQAFADTVTFASIGQTVPLPAVPVGQPSTDQVTEQYGLVLQDQVNWGRWHGLLGVRDSFYHASSTPPGQPASDDDAQKWTPTAGLVFDVTGKLSIYGSYTQAFTPQPAGTETVSGAMIPPTLSTRWEAGVKSSFFNDRLDLNASLYTLTTNNEALTDPTNPLFFIAGPGERAKGFETSATGAITPTLNVMAGYAYAGGDVVGGAPIQEAPTNVVNFWVLKTFNLSRSQAVDLGFGGNYNNGFWLQQGSGPQIIYFDRDALTFDAALGYKIGKFKVNLTVDNLFDRRNYDLSGGTLTLERAEPRTFRVVIDKTF
jgi:iron complex outermembrane recepter protein